MNIDFSNVKLLKIITNLVGNKLQEEGYQLSQELSHVSPESEEYLNQYFLSQIQPIEFYHFTHSVEIELNEVYKLVSNIFDGEADFVEESHNFTKLLYENSTHPKIKSGELNVVLFDDVIADDEMVNAVGIFKSETNVPFINMQKEEGTDAYGINHRYGYELKGIDKGCLILNTARANGYVVLIVDKISGDAQYWMNDFLKVETLSSDFSETKAFMDMTKHFITKELEADTGIDKTEKIEIINKTVEYFKTNETFDKEEFESHVLKEPEVIESFQNFAPTYCEDRQINISESFGISNQAVKKQIRRFKNILKLDKNFQIYINGDKSLIEKGVEPDGRKFYKIYYEHEE